MNYIRKKYKGYRTVSAESLKDELLLNDEEFATMKKQVGALLGRKTCPSIIEVDMLEYMVDQYL